MAQAPLVGLLVLIVSIYSGWGQALSLRLGDGSETENDYCVVSYPEAGALAEGPVGFEVLRSGDLIEWSVLARIRFHLEQDDEVALRFYWSMFCWNSSTQEIYGVRYVEYFPNPFLDDKISLPEERQVLLGLRERDGLSSGVSPRYLTRKPQLFVKLRAITIDSACRPLDSD